jgi:mersacidin/lichenicidin family type 2 lantibiotic
MKFDIVRAWKDESYRNSLSTQEQAMLPENPAGALDLSDTELEAIHGACYVNGNVSNHCTAPIQVGRAINEVPPGGGNSIAVANSCVPDCP